MSAESIMLQEAIDECKSFMAKFGQNHLEFEFKTIDRLDFPEGELHATRFGVEITKKFSNKTKTYQAGNGSSFPSAFISDLENGYFR